MGFSDSSCQLYMVQRLRRQLGVLHPLSPAGRHGTFRSQGLDLAPTGLQAQKTDVRKWSHFSAFMLLNKTLTWLVLCL